MHVAVPTRLAGAGDGMPCGHHGGEGDSVHLHEHAGGQGKEKLKAWLGTWFQVTFGFCSERGVESGGRGESRAPLSAPPQATWVK